MKNNESKIEQLASQILEYKKSYYLGNSSIDDSTYDEIEEQLKQLSPNHPVLQMVGSEFFSENKDKIIHIPPMLSLEKTYSIDDLHKFVTKNPCVCMNKLDGMALSIEYDKSGKILRASTRGNGILGENATEYVYHIISIPKYLDLSYFKNMPDLITLEVRGEVFFPIDKFEEFIEQFDSYRNAIPGTFGRKNVSEAIPILNILQFASYDLIAKDSNNNLIPINYSSINKNTDTSKFINKLQLMECIGFYTGLKEGLVSELSIDINLESLQEKLEKEFAQEKNYKIDGLVFRINDEKIWNELGNTSHHPRGSLAFKQAGEVANTKIIAIEEAIGRSGKITFRAKLQPVYLSGATISYATLHNAEFIEAGGYAPGAEVKIKRSGEVIPSIIGLIKESTEKYTLPKLCPCNLPLTRQGPDLYCFNKGECVYKNQEYLTYFVQNIGFQGISEKIVYKLREAGLLKSPADLYKLTTEMLLNVEGFANKSAENLIKTIQDNRNIPLGIFLTALGLTRGGKVKCQEVASKYKTLANIFLLTVEDLTKEKGWAKKSAEDFLNSIHEKELIIKDLENYINILPEKETNQAITSNLTGKNICVTGTLSKPRDEIKDKIIAAGAKVTEAVNAKTNYLVCNQASNSSKYQSAIKLNIPIINEEELEKLLS